MSTLYKHEIYCLHGDVGQLTADTAATDTTLAVQVSAITDVSIAVGSVVILTDGSNTSPHLIITAVDDTLNTIAVDTAVGFAFLAAAPTTLVRIPHWASSWTESLDELKYCPEDPSHVTQAGSGRTTNIRNSNIVTIEQSAFRLTRPQVRGELVEAPPGENTVIDFHWPYAVTVQEIAGYFEIVNIGDSVDFLAAPDTPVGVLTSAANIGDTVFSVSDTAAVALSPSVILTISGGALDVLGRVASVDATQKTVTVETAATVAHPAGSVVLMTPAPAYKLPAPCIPSVISVGGTFLLGTDLPPNTPLRIVYRNVGPSEARMLLIAKYLA